MTPKRSSAHWSSRATARSKPWTRPTSILYNTCSIRDKAEQKVFHRLNEYKKLQRAGKEVCRPRLRGAAGRREDLRAAPYVPGLPDRRPIASCPRCWCSLEAGNVASPGSTIARPTRPSRPSSPPAPIPIAATSPSSKAATSSAPTAWCPYTRGKERSRTSDSVLAEARRMADPGYTEIQLLGQNVNSYRDPAGEEIFAELLAAVGEFQASAASVSPPRIRAISPRHRRGHRRRSRRSAITCICRCRAAPRACSQAMARIHARAVPRAHRLDEVSARRDLHHQRHHRRLSRRDRSGLRRDASLCWRRCSTTASSPSSTRRGRTRRRLDLKTHSGRREVASIAVLLERQREIQKAATTKHFGTMLKLWSKGKTRRPAAVDRPNSQNKTLNFTAAGGPDLEPGSYYRTSDCRLAQQPGWRI